MPLSSTCEAANCELYSNNVYFVMTSGGHRIRCGVTDLALERGRTQPLGIGQPQRGSIERLCLVEI
jgi:hypothetical protein